MQEQTKGTFRLDLIKGVFYFIFEAQLMKRRIEVHKSNNKSHSKSLSKQATQRNCKELQPIKDDIKYDDKVTSKSYNKGKSPQIHLSQKKSKDIKRQSININQRNQKAAPKQENNFIHNRKRTTASIDKAQKNTKFFQRKNNNNQNKSSKKISKKSSNNQNDVNQIEKLKTENEYYKKAFLASKESLQKLQKYLQQEKQKRNNNKIWFKAQIDNLKKQITSDKVKLGHIFTFQSFRNQEISNMIIQTQNQSSSLMVPTRIAEEIEQALSNLSLQSK